MTPSPTQKQNPGQNPKVHDFKSRFGVVPDSPPPKLTRLQARRAKRKRVRAGMIAFSVMLGIAGGTAFLIAQDFDHVASFFKPQPVTKQVQTADAPPPPSAPVAKTTTEESPVLLPQATAPAPAVAPPAKPAAAATVVAETPAAVPPPASEPVSDPAPPAIAASGVTAETEPETSAISLDPPPAEPPPPAPVVAEASPEPQIQPEPVPAPAVVPEPNETIASAAPPQPQTPPQPVAAAAPPQPKFVPKITTESFQYPSPPVVTPEGVLTAGAAQTQTKVVTVTTPAQPEAIADTAAAAPAAAPPQPAAPVQEQQVAMAAPASETAAPVVKPSSGAQLVQGQVFRDCENCPDLVVVLPPQGLPPEQIGRAKIPAGAEPLKPYAIGRFEVTFDDWARCMAGGGCSAQPDDAGWGRNTRPVINVSHDDAVQQYIAWLSSVTGATYRLPTGIEWDFAEEGGGVIPASGVPLIDSQTICQSGNYVSAQASSPQEASCADGFPTTAPAGSFKPNALGLHDMRGNVWEWVSDCWTPGFTFRVKDSERDCRKRLLRGGSWSSRAALSATPPRGFEVATRASKSIGFRVARTLP